MKAFKRFDDRLKVARSYVTGSGLGAFLVRAVAGSGAVQIAGMAVGFLVGIQLARGLGVTGYGYYGIAMAVVTLFTIPGSLGIPKLVTREVAAAQSSNDRAAIFGVLQWADRICGGLSAAIASAVAIGGFVTWRTASPVLGLTILLGAPLVALLPLAAIRAGALRGLHYIVLGQIPTVLFRPLALSALLFALFVAGVELGAPMVMALNSIIAFLILLLTHHWLTRRLGKMSAPSPPDGRGWLGRSIPMALTDALASIQLQLAMLVLGIVASPEEVGLFRVCTSTVLVVAVPLGIVNAVVMPMFSSLHAKGDHSRLQKLVTATAFIQFAGVFVLALPLLLAAGPLLSRMFGSDYAPAENALRILCLSWLISASFGPNYSLLNMTGHERRVTRAFVTMLTVNVIFMAALTPSLGPLGAALGVLAGQTVANIALWLDARRLLRINTSLWSWNALRRP